MLRFPFGISKFSTALVYKEQAFKVTYAGLRTATKMVAATRFFFPHPTSSSIPVANGDCLSQSKKQ